RLSVFVSDTTITDIYTLSLHDALPILKDFAITSEGEVFENPKYLRKAQSKLKYVQRKYSKHKGKRTKQRLALLHEKVVNKRKDRSEEHTSELQSRENLVCRLLLEKKNE